MLEASRTPLGQALLSPQRHRQSAAGVQGGGALPSITKLVNDRDRILMPKTSLLTTPHKLNPQLNDKVTAINQNPNGAVHRAFRDTSKMYVRKKIYKHSSGIF